MIRPQLAIGTISGQLQDSLPRTISAVLGARGESESHLELCLRNGMGRQCPGSDFEQLTGFQHAGHFELLVTCSPLSETEETGETGYGPARACSWIRPRVFSVGSLQASGLGG